MRLKCHIFFIQRTYSGDEATRLGENGLVAMNPNCAYVRIFFESVAFLCGKGTQFYSVAKGRYAYKGQGHVTLCVHRLNVYVYIYT